MQWKCQNLLLREPNDAVGPNVVNNDADECSINQNVLVLLHFYSLLVDSIRDTVDGDVG